MRKTNCKRMTKMMSLYIAGDLVGEPEREAASHLATCEGCRQLASQFSKSSSLLTQAWAQPDFGAEFYAGIRSAVLGEISHHRVPSKPSIFGGRWLYAASLAVVIIASGVMLQYRRIAPETSQGLAANSPGLDRPTSGRAKGADPSSSPQLSELRWPRRSRRPVEVRIPDALNTAGAARDDRKQIAPAIVALTAGGGSALESATLSGQSASSSSGAASSSEVSRIEIQTADPNIRIIWLSSRDSRKSEESNHDRDPENGDRN